MIKKTWILFGMYLSLMSFSAFAASLKPGIWRFELKTAHANIPFLISFKANKDQVSAKLHNGKETISLNQITMTQNSISIPLDTYEVSLELKFEGAEKLSGNLVRHNKVPKKETPVEGTFGVNERFTEVKEKPSIDLNGSWAVTLDDEGKKTQGIIVFEQKGNILHGSILTPTGDYRYLEGFVSGNHFRAASFDGIYNYLLEGKIESQKLTAAILSSAVTKVEGKKDEKAALPDAYAQTQLDVMKFNFPDLSGKNLSLDDPQFKNKPVIVQFFGSWCPNCLDETSYLVPWFSQNKKRGIEIVALAFERSLSLADAKKQLHKIKDRYKLNYPILLAGATAEDKPADKIKGLKNFSAFPTTVFLNKKHEVVKVHAGFNGPSTGQFYKNWQKEFNQMVNELLK